MALEQRKRRRAPQRAGPERAPFARAEAVNGAAAGVAIDVDDGPHPDEGVIVRAAVKAAYQVVEDNIQEGRRAAERLGAAAPPLSEPAPNTRTIANRLMHVTKDLGATWVDLIVAVLREPEVRAMLDRVTLHDRARPRPADAAGATPTPIVQRISSRKPIEVTLSSLPARSYASPPAITAVYSLNAGVPPIGGVQFGLRPGGGLELQIDVADDQPPGTYVGAVVDVDSQKPVGTLAVKVLE